MMWQPIETAPRDQTFLAVLNCAGEQTICTMRWAVAEAKNSRPDHCVFHIERVTHWMPLPALPGAQPAPSFADAYQGAMEEVAIWKRRALEAETLNRKFIAGINGPMHMGEPAQPAPSLASNDVSLISEGKTQPAPSIPDGWLRAIDEALIVAHIGVANPSDTYEQAKAKLDNLIGFHVDAATDPAVNGG